MYTNECSKFLKQFLNFVSPAMQVFPTLSLKPFISINIYIGPLKDINNLKGSFGLLL